MKTAFRGPKQKYLKAAARSLTTTHGKMLALGAIAGLIFLPTWLSVIWRITFIGGKSTLLLNLGFLYFGLAKLWQNRSILVDQPVLSDDRLVGHLFIIGGFAALATQADSSSIQAFSAMLVLAGALASTFGLAILKEYPLACGMLLLSLYPDWAFLSTLIFQILTGPSFLENRMAQMGGFVLNQMGQPAVAQGQYISLPAGSVYVGSGCSGFDMAFSVAVCSLLLGLFLKQTWPKISFAILIGVCLALLLNIPRIVLLSFAGIYWGEASFDFWHGAWGGQIFSGLLFTMYYYVVMAIYKKQPRVVA